MENRATEQVAAAIELTTSTTERSIQSICPLTRKGGVPEGLFQPIHILVILVIAVLVFGPKKLPELGKGLGEVISGFRKALREGAESTEDTAQKK